MKAASGPELPARLVVCVVYVVFFLSGACTLVYELVWTRMLVLVFGTSVLAVSTVLAAFMAGLALGAWWFGRRIDRHDNGLRVYAYLEFGVAVCAVLFPLLLSRLDGLYTEIYRALGGNDAVFALIRFSLLFVVLLVPTTLMGGTLPVLAKHVVRRLDALGRGVGLLYAVNTLGAVAGCAATAYLLIEAAGTRGATHLAAAVNLLIGVAALVLARATPDTPGASAGAPRPAARARASIALGGLRRLVLWGLAFSGFAALGYEVLWTRLLTMVLHITTVQSLSTILIVFLTGLALGGAAATRFVDRLPHLPTVFGGLQLLLGLFGLSSVALLGSIPSWLPLLDGFPSWSGHMFKLFAVSFAVMIGPTFVMGMLFPLAARIYIDGLDGLGARVGQLYAANTGGAILGAFLTGFALIPAIGTQFSMWTLASINLAIGIAVPAADAWPRRKVKLALAAIVAIGVVLLIAALPADQLANLFHGAQPDGTLLHFDEALGGTVTVHAMPSGIRLLRVNGAGEVPTDRASIRTFRLLGSLPMLLHPDAQQVLIVAYGGGVTLAAVEMHGPRTIDCVEVMPRVVEASRLFGQYNDRVFDRIGQGAIRLIADDGRNHILRTERRYDVIVSDSTHPSTADSWILYTEEFYRLCRARLNEGGIVAQWLPLHGLSAADHQMILRTFRAVFPYATLWLTRGYGVLLATPEPLTIDFDRLQRRLSAPRVARSLQEVDLDDPISFLAALALDERAFAEYAGSGPLNTDDRPYLSFDDRTRAGTGTGVFVLYEILPHLVEQLPRPPDGIGNDGLARLGLRFRARRHVFAADVALRIGNRERAIEELRRARTIDPTGREAERMLRSLEGGG